jgi:hypothetical protein
MFVKYGFENTLVVDLDPKTHLSWDKLWTKMVPLVQPGGIGALGLIQLSRFDHDAPRTLTPNAQPEARLFSNASHSRPWLGALTIATPLSVYATGQLLPQIFW